MDEQSGDEKSADEQPRDEPAEPNRWIDERPATDGSLPGDVVRLMSRFYTADSVETVGDFVAATRADAGGGAIDVEDLCHVEGDSRHVASTPEETYHFRCFYDGIALSLLADEPVAIATESPAGNSIEVRATPDGEVQSTPEGAVVSFGIAADVETAGESGPDPEDVYAAVCPYVKAFRSREEYESWAAAVDAATLGMPLAAGMPVAMALTEDR